MHTQVLFIVYHISLWRNEKIRQRNTLMEIEFRSCEYQNQWTIACQVLLSVGFPGKNTGVGIHSLQGMDQTQTRDQTQVSCIAGRFFTIWSTREAPRIPFLWIPKTEVFLYQQDQLPWLLHKSEDIHPLQCQRTQGVTYISLIPAWRIPWTEETGGLQSMGLQRVGHDWATNTVHFLTPPNSYWRLCQGNQELLNILQVNIQRRAIYSARLQMAFHLSYK